MDVHAAEFSATAELRKHLARIEQAFRIEGAFQPLLLIQVDLVEHRVHEIALLDADPMLARQNAANMNTEPEDLRAKRLSPVQFTRLVGVIKDQRMKVAVTGVKDVGHAQPEARLHLFHLLKYAADLSARDRSVHAVIVGGDSANRRKSRLSPRPEQQSLRFGLARSTT